MLPNVDAFAHLSLSNDTTNLKSLLFVSVRALLVCSIHTQRLLRLNEPDLRKSAHQNITQNRSLSGLTG